MRMKIYNYLVNRNPGICRRYHQMHDGKSGSAKFFSWIYLFILNIAVGVFHVELLNEPTSSHIYEEKHLLLDKSESECASETHLSVEELVEQLQKYDVISFDIFDTLIFRPFTEPTDLFYFVGEKLEILDFKRIRMEMEARARYECFEKNKHHEVTLSDIWNCMERETGISSEIGMKLEMQMEDQFCYANPYMQEVFRRLQDMDKTIIVISDMYLPEKYLQKMLANKGYSGIQKLYVSCEYGMSKGNGKLFDVAKNDFGNEKSYVHIGDNEHSDVNMAKKQGFSSVYYPNVNKMALSYRAYDMSPVIGGAYRGIIDNHLYYGTKKYSMEYEYGFIYGGLFVVGYCNFIHEYKQKNNIDKILFLSRDGDILRQVYKKMYPEDQTAYVYWSRAAATKLMARYNKYDFFRRYLYHKVNQKKTIYEVLDAMDLLPICEEVHGFKDESGSLGADGSGRIYLTDYLTDKNVEILKKYLQLHMDQIIEIYAESSEAAKDFYYGMVKDCKKVCAVDIGWAGSGAMSLTYLFDKVWKIPCELTGIVAGTNTLHNAEPDASEIFLQSGKLVSYLYSQSTNRDLMRKHDLNRNYNVYWELLLSSPQKHFLGFGYDEKHDIQLQFGDVDENITGIEDVQRGIRDFADEYIGHFEKFPYMFAISGRDAYAPMLLASSYQEQYLKMIGDKFALDINV